MTVDESRRSKMIRFLFVVVVVVVVVILPNILLTGSVSPQITWCRCCVCCSACSACSACAYAPGGHASGEKNVRGGGGEEEEEQEEEEEGWGAAEARRALTA